MVLRRVAGYACITTGLAGLLALFVGGIVRSLEPPATADEMLALGEERLGGGDLPGAAEWFAKAVRADPSRSEARLARGRVDELSGDSEAAVAAYRKALELAPDELGPALALARALVAAGRPREAEQALEQARRRHPRSEEPVVQLARLRLEGGDLDGARRTFEELEGLLPRDARGALGVAMVEEARGEPAAARAAYERATTVDPRSREAWEGLGRIAATTADLDAAERSYRRLVELRPDDAGALTVLATVVERRGRFDEAIRLFRRAITLLERAEGDALQTRALAWTGLGTCLLAAGRGDEAYEALAAALTDDPDQPEALWALVPVYLDREQFAAARDAVLGTVGHRGEEPMYWVSLGRAEAGLGRWREAHRAFGRALELDASGVEAARWYGIALRVLGDYRAAATVLAGSAERATDDGLVRLNLAIALGQLGEVSRAREEFGRARELLPEQAEPLTYEAHLLLSTGMVDQAGALAERALALAPDDPATLEVLARVLARRGDRARADRLVARAIERATDEAQRRYLEELRARIAGAGDLGGSAPHATAEADPERDPAR